ncbi:amino acid adenylation domain-containing protein [Streptomyces sp. NPDC094447]|uniref:amino acid adenylation domain-containing protein n=1 Tax=Streptomyces sp. NPDC094447 TaxID=3366062 RepID=UPI0037FCCCBD
MTDALIHELFAQQAAATPDTPALVHGTTTLSYRELDEAAEGFALRLHEAGVHPGDIVPVVLPRSIPLVISFLGILKRGAAYAAFDPVWPSERLHRLTRKTGAPVVVTYGEALGGRIALSPPRPEDGRPSTPPVPLPPAPVTADRPATVFFTSGTTGEPKGVLSPHSGTVRLFADCSFAELGPRTVMPLTSAVPWDALTLELWSMLLNGGTSVVVDEPYLLPAKLRSLVAEHGVNCVSLTSTLFHMFVDEDIDAFTGVSQVFVGGEKVSPARLGSFLERFPSARLLHCYGPVETTLFATVHQVRPQDCTLPGGVPLGAPVARTGLYIQNGDQPCAPGERGELLISGAGLALGYLGDPERTTLSFPTLRLDGSDRRVYRTGDLVHRTADGRLHFDGRADRQVKIRGHRIEPAEVEQVAGAYPGIRQCAAFPLPDGAGGHGALALAYTATPGREPTAHDLEEHLRRTLPPYMLPSSLLQLATLPLNANGKLDTAELLRLVSTTETVATPVTQAHGVTLLVASTIAGVLGRDSVPLDQAFFALGGNSLQLGVVCSRLTQETGIPVPISVAMRHPSVTELAAWLAERSADTAPPAEAPASLSGRVRGAPLTETQTAFWTRQMMDPDDLSGLCPLVWRVDGEVDADALDAALTDVHDRHESLRSAFDGGPDGLRPTATPAPPTSRGGAGTRLRLLAPQATPDAALAVVRESLLRPLDPETGPVWRSALARVPSHGTAVLGIVLHHVAFDGGSEAVLVADLAAAYAARARGEEPRWPSPAPTLPQTRDELDRVLGQAGVDAQRAYWKDRLTGTPELALPQPARCGDRASADTLAFALGSAESATVRDLARLHGTTPFHVLLATVARALHLITGQGDFAVGVPVSRRATPLLAGAVDCLVDTVCIRLDSFPDGWDGFLRDTADSAVAALSHQDVPFTEVVRLVNPPRSARAPLYQFLFVYQEAAPSALRLGEAEAAPVRVPAADGVCEVVTEVWPGPGGSFEVDITYQTDRVSDAFPPMLRDQLTALLRSAGPATVPTGA